MSLTNPETVVTEERLSEFYTGILPYLGGMPDILANKFSKGDLYSTDEKLIGRWIDGKPLYQKTVQLTLPNTEGSDIPIGYLDVLLGNNIMPENIVGFHGTAQYEATPYYGTVIINNNQASDNAVGIYVGPVNNRATIMAQVRGSWFYNKPVTLTFQYTKTTDSAVDIGSDTDYSTTEKIVGTWIDGKPLYQKTLSFTNITVSPTQTNIGDISSLNINFGMVENITGKEVDSDNNIFFEGFSHLACWLRVSSGNLGIKNTENKSITFVNLYVTLQYTKTT